MTTTDKAAKADGLSNNSQHGKLTGDPCELQIAEYMARIVKDSRPLSDSEIDGIHEFIDSNEFNSWASANKHHGPEILFRGLAAALKLKLMHEEGEDISGLIYIN